EQVRPLLPAGPGCLVLVTSRDPLGGLVARDGARLLNLDVLAPVEARALLVAVLGADRVEAEPDAVDELARLCAYLPLALRIAAANVTVHRNEKIAAYTARLRRSDRLAALAVHGDPQTAVRAAFDLSYVALPEPAQRLFGLLGLAPGSDVTIGAAAALAATTLQEAGQLLGSLARAGLISEPVS